MTPDDIFILSGIVFVAFSIHAITGFGSLITALVLSAWRYDFTVVQPTFVALSVALNIYFVARSRATLPVRMLARFVLPWMALGTAVGFAVAGRVAGPALLRGFGAFVAMVAARELWRAWRHADAVTGDDPRPPRAWILASGLIHGIYATGGPPLVYALSRSGLDKSQLRAALCAVQLVFGSALLIGFAGRGTLNVEAGMRALTCAPALFVAIAFGSWAHERVDPQRFRLLLFAVLLLASVGLMVR